MATNPTPHKPSFDDVLRNAQGVGVLSGEEIEAEEERARNSGPIRRCRCGGSLHFSMAVGAWRCPCGGLYRDNGSRVR